MLGSPSPWWGPLVLIHGSLQLGRFLLEFEK